MRRAIDVLCSPTIVGLGNGLIEQSAAEFIEKVNAWRANLPEQYQFSSQQKLPAFTREQSCLSFQFYSTKITISRIFVNWWDQCQASNRQRFLSEGRRQMADVCTDSACKILSHLPDRPDLVLLARIGPWWFMVYVVMQSVTALFVKLDSRLKVGRKDLSSLLACVQK
jgi:hypothetical protein